MLDYYCVVRLDGLDCVLCMIGDSYVMSGN